MKSITAFSAACMLLFSVACQAADHQIEAIDAGPPEEVSKEIASLLGEKGFKVVRGTSRTVCEVWLCKEWPLAADAKVGPQMLYPFKPGQIIGVARYTNKGGDFRDQDINTGVYTIRYAHQPVDGAHVGTSPTRDFLLLIEASKDKSAAPLDYMALVERSAEAAESTHPALLSLQKPAEQGKSPSIRHDEEKDWWIARAAGTVKKGDKASELAIEFVVVGYAEE